MTEKDSYDLKRPNFVAKEFSYRISQELSIDRMKARFETIEEDWGDSFSAVPPLPPPVGTEPEGQAGPLVEELQALLTGESIPKESLKAILDKYRQAHPEEQDIRWGLFRRWFNSQSLEAYFLRQYIESSERVPYLPERIEGYRSADLQYSGFTYVGCQKITDKECEALVVMAIRIVAEEIYLASLGLCAKLLKDIHNSALPETLNEDEKKTFTNELKKAVTYIDKQGVNYCEALALYIDYVNLLESDEERKKVEELLAGISTKFFTSHLQKTKKVAFQ